MSRMHTLLVAVLAGFGVTVAASDAYSAGFFLNEQSVTASGRGFAGVSAATDDAGIIAYNPAGMTELGKGAGGVGGYVIIPHANLDDAGSSLMIGPNGPFPLAGNSTGQGFYAQPTGYFYASSQFSSDLWFGLAITTPFGLKADYDADFFGRYDGLKSSLVVVQIAPSVAYWVNDYVSVGASVTVQRATATLSTALPNPLAPGGPSPASDGLLTVKGSDWSVGFTVGVHVRPMDGLEMGLDYRSGVKHTLAGNATTDFAGAKTVQGAHAPLRLPDVISAGLSYQVNDVFSVMGEVSHFGWNKFKQLRIIFEDNTETATTENFSNSWSVSAGGEFKVGNALSTRAGVEYDQTPTQDAYRSTRIPDTDRLWATIGASYLLSRTWRVDVSYAHLFSRTAPVNRDNEFPALFTSVTTKAITRTSSNVLGLALQARF